LDAKPAAGNKPAVAVAETFDDLTYTVKIAKRDTGEDYLVSVTVAGEPPKTRTPEKDEKADQKERRDKEFAETRKRLENRIAREQALSKWTYVVGKKDVEPLLKARADLVAKKGGKGEKGPPRFPFPG
jgi:hypothetical protein